jgi:hypothetical protein
MKYLIEALSHPKAYPHATGTIDVVETHISWIFLTEPFAYKIKKPLDLGFLDFSTIAKRRHYCYEELRLNQRLCPEIYLSVVPVVQSGETILVDAEGEIIDYAVKMVQFDRTMELDRMLSQKLLKEKHIDHLAIMIARFHISQPPVPDESSFGHPDNVLKPMLHNFTTIEPIISGKIEIDQLAQLKTVTVQKHQQLYNLLLQRKNNGFIRQCHGDMHTGNMVLWKKRIFIFDCIEFNESLSNIDVISDLAFLFMDLEHGGAPELAWRLLNNYLTETADYTALPLLSFYALYRAMVRAKVTAIRYEQTADSTKTKAILEEHRSYIDRALDYSLSKKPMLIITFGVSGSGKTVVSGKIAQAMRCIHIRSDIERKRLAGLKSLERNRDSNALYTENFNLQTYRKLLDLATLCIHAELSVIVDATFIKMSNRKMFLELAEELKIPFRILHFFAPDELLMERVRNRSLIGNDASDANTDVLAKQLEQQEKLTAEESSVALAINTEHKVDAAAVASLLQSATAS